MRRMDRYKDASDETRSSRSDNNKELYESIGSNTRYTSFTDVTNANAIDLSSKKNYNTREGYHQMKEYQDVVPTPRAKKDLEEFKSVYQNRENRVYDINNVLEEARKNRVEKDELEEKRKLKNTSYNILASLNPEELEKYRQEKKERLRADDEDLRELIDTITSATLAGDIKVASELLGDLMATSIMDKIDDQDLEEDDSSEKAPAAKDIDSKNEEPEEKESTSEEQADEDDDDDSDEQEDYKLSLSKEILDLQELKKMQEKIEKSQQEEPEKKENIMSNADEDFYTRSMDLSDQDFELDEEFKDKKLPLVVKILIFLIILVVLAAVFYFLWNQI